MSEQFTETERIRFDPKSLPKSGASDFLVCGLGSLGQYCVAKLKEFGMTVSAIDPAPPRSWEISNLPDLLENLVIGDCRQHDILKQVKIEQYQAVLLVISDERINIDAAFAIRVFNPQVRLVIRSGKEKLNQLLEQRLGNFVALAVTHLTAPAFAIAALDSEIQGVVPLDDHLLRIVKHSLGIHHRWCDRRLVYELNNRTRRILSHASQSTELPTEFYQWEPDARIQVGDTIAYIELSEGLAEISHSPNAVRAQTKTRQKFPLRHRIGNFLARYGFRQLKGRLIEFWRSLAQHKPKQVVFLVGITVLTLIVLGTLVLKLTHPQQSWLRTLYVTGVMLLGSYDIVYGALSPNDTMPLWMRFMNLGYMLAGTASIAVLYALLTESLLASKFQLLSKRPSIPQQDYILLIGLDRLGRQTATLLQKLKQPLVGISQTNLEVSAFPQIPLVIGELTEVLTKVNLCGAKSVVVATDDEMVNLEIGLMVQAANPRSKLVIRTFDPHFSNNLAHLLPSAEVLCVYALAAEAFAAAAFGENILNLLRLNEQTILVSEYHIQPGDFLNGLLLAEVAYGYRVVPILHQSGSQKDPALMPSDDLRLTVGDRLVVLATINSLHQIEQNEISSRCWQVEVDRVLTRESSFEAARAIARISGADLRTATELMDQLPGVLPIPLYKHQAQRLVRELWKIQTLAHLKPMSEDA